MSASFVFTASEAYVRQAIAELRSLDNRLSSFRALGPGVIRFATSVGREEFLERISRNEPVFVRHLHPVDATVDVTGTELDPDLIAGAAAQLLQGLGSGEAVAVQVRRFGEEIPYSRYAVKERLDPMIAAAGGLPVIQGAARILSVTADEAAACLGLSTAAQNLSDWTGGEIRFKREEEQISRAKFKLLEAFERFPIPAQPGSRALDLGAAPGGWTSLLLERGFEVTAVDTAELSEVLRQHPKLTVVKRNAEEVAFEPGSFDLMTCDMSWNPLHTAEMVTRLAPAARIGAHVVLTVKLMLDNPTRTVRKVGEVLERRFRLLKTKQLFHNRDEVTMHLIRAE